MRTLGLLLFLTACTSDPATTFLGTWTYHDGMVTTTCDIGGTSTMQTRDLTGAIQTITRGGHSDLATTDTGCPIALDISDSGSLADLVPGTDCIVGDVTSSFSFYRFERANLTPLGATTAIPGLDVTIFAESSGLNGTCQIDGTGFLVK